jgi:alkanesulfonate monooxygenase SsuD/methylene tetrahydromethanopterin reductase-like flavin-dependent oxidoreductase (luciferase family)
VDHFRRSRDALFAQCHRIGRDPRTIRLNYYAPVTISDEEVPENPVLHVVSGTPQQVAEELHGFLELGVSHLMVRFTDFTSLERFRDEALPLLVDGRAQHA